MNKHRSTIRDIAEKAGVGVATVDRVLNRRARVSHKTVARVMKAAEELNYHAVQLLKERTGTMAPAMTLGFILQQRRKWFYRELDTQLRRAAADASAIRASVIVEYVDSLVPENLVTKINEMRDRVDCLGLVSVDHHSINQAISKCTSAGIPVFALLSPLSSQDLTGYVGINGRKAGRTAGWMMSRLVNKGGEIGIMVGSHRYLGHEALEAGFRSYMRENAPQCRLRDSMVYLDDADMALEASLELLESVPDMAGLYQCGGGVSGTLKLLDQRKRTRRLSYICHGKSPAAIRGLANGSIAMVISAPVHRIAQEAIRSMVHVLIEDHDASNARNIDFELITSENF